MSFFLLKVGPPPPEKFSGSAPDGYGQTNTPDSMLCSLRTDKGLGFRGLNRIIRTGLFSNAKERRAFSKLNITMIKKNI